MSIQHAILGFLSWTPLTGYDLKKLFAESTFLYWSGNNNQIYRALIDLHRAGLVTQAIDQPESGPARKVYTITGEGLAELRRWVLAPPELPQLRDPFLIQLAWADQLDRAELDDLLDAYEEELRVRVLMLREQAQRGQTAPRRTAREALLWDRMADRWIALYEGEMAWVRDLRRELDTLESEDDSR